MRLLQELEQGSNEWLKWRSEGIGSSDIASILNISPYKKAYDLWLEKTGQKEPEDLSSNFYVLRGTALEPDARDQFNDLSHSEFIPCLFQSDEHPFFKYSSDGYWEERNAIIEIKCNGDKNHKLAKAGQIPDYYMAQIQFGLLVSKADHCVYISYSPEDITPLAHFIIYPDANWFEKITFNGVNFWLNNVLNKVNPLYDSESFEVKEESIKKALDVYKSLKLEIDLKSKELDNLEEQIKTYFKENSIKKTRHNGLEVSYEERKGSVDYARIPELIGVDLEKYRKEKTSYYKFKIK